SWSVGSAPPMKIRLPRLPRTMIWYWAASLASMTFLGSFWASTADRSSKGSARAPASVCARSAGDTEPAAMTDATKLVLLSREERTSSSAVFGFSLPAWTSTRATPESAECGASARVSNLGALVQSSRKRMIIADSPRAVNVVPDEARQHFTPLRRPAQRPQDHDGREPESWSG